MSEAIYELPSFEGVWSQAKKAAETGTIIAPSQEKELVAVQQAKQDNAVQSTKPTSKENVLSDLKRYKNPLLMVFAIMAIARKTLRDGLQETKTRNRHLKREWELISKENAASYEKAEKNMNSQQKITMGIMGVTMFFPQVASAFTKWDSGWNFASKATGLSSAIKFLGETKPKFIETLTDYNSKAKDFGLQWVRTKGDLTGQEVKKETVIIDMRSQAAQSDYQTRVQDESSEKQAIDGLNRTNEELMNKESQLFMAKGA